MSYDERKVWILQYIKDHNGFTVDVLNGEFCYAYIEATGAKHKLYMYGAPQCRQLGRDLGAMYRDGLLTRSSIGLAPGDSFMGFPKWVYVYRLKEASNNE